MRLDRDALDMIATARIFAAVDMLPADYRDCGCGGADHDECALANSYTVTHHAGPADDGAPVVDELEQPDDAGPLIIAAIIGASQALILALLEIIDSDDEARLAMAKETAPVDGARADIDPTLFAAWADTKEMAKHFAEQARARELEIRAEMGTAMVALVDGQPAIQRVKRTEQVRAHPRNIDFLQLIRWDGGTP